MADQTQFEIPDIDELDAMKKQNDQLLADVAAVRSHVSELEAGVPTPLEGLALICDSGMRLNTFKSISKKFEFISWKNHMNQVSVNPRRFSRNSFQY